ncbi:MAG: M24 family metallopeptidase, partial [Gammaproteobacteria bacterium]
MKSETKIFQKRRKELMDSIGSNGIAILPAAIESVRNKDVNFRFRQDSDFYYLSGFEEPEAVIVIAPQRKHGEYIIFCREKNPEKETWDGYRAGQEGACEIFGGDDAFPIDDIDDILPGLIEGREKLYYSMGTNRGFDKQVMQWINNIRENIRGGAKAPHELISLDGILHEMRLIKDSEEISIIKKAAEISAQAHNRAMSLCKPGMYEYELEAEFLYQFRKNGGTEAYPSIVGSGANGCTLHYIENSSIMKNGDLVLIDAGMEYKGYAADISRTFPVNGKF